MEIKISTESLKYLLAVDPGLDKIGLAVLNYSGDIISRSVVPKSDFPVSVSALINSYQPEIIVVGGGTGSDHVFKILSSLNFSRVVRINERNTTLDARDLAWKSDPPGGFCRLLPKLFWPIPKDLDSWAAVVIGRKALETGELSED